MKDIFDIQSDVARKIATALQAKISPAEKERLAKKQTENLTAYDYYLKGRDYYYRYHKSDNEIAIELFKKAIKLDPDYALAYTGLGDAYAQLALKFGFDPTWLDSAIEASKKAISIDPELAEAHKALGLAYTGKRWWHKAHEANQKAVELNPNHFPAVANVGYTHWLIGEYDEALKWMKKAVALNPTSAYSYCLVGKCYMSLNDYAKAELWTNKALELQPDLIFAHTGLFRILLAQGKDEQAITHSREIVSSNPDDVNALAFAGEAELILGNYSQAKQYYENAMEVSAAPFPGIAGMSLTIRLAYISWKTDQPEKSGKMLSQCLDLAQKWLEQGDESWYIPYEMAVINAVLGNKPEAFKWLKKAIEAGWREYHSAFRDPLLENLYNEEQFKQMMAEVKAMVDEMRKRVEVTEKE